MSKTKNIIHESYDDSNLVLNFMCPYDISFSGYEKFQEFDLNDFSKDLVNAIYNYYMLTKDLKLIQRVKRYNTFTVRYYPISNKTTVDKNREAGMKKYSAYFTNDSLYVLPFQVIYK